MPVGLGSLIGGDPTAASCGSAATARTAGSRRGRSHEGGRHRPAGGPVEQFDRVHDRGRGEARDLHHAAEIAGRDDVRIDAVDVGGLALAERGRDLGLQQVVGAGGTAAEMPLGYVEHLETGAGQQLPWWAGHALAVLQRAGVVIGDAIRLGRAVAHADVRQQFGDVARERADPPCGVAVDEMAVVLDRRAAAGRVDDDGIETGCQLPAPGRDIGAGEAPAMFVASHVERQGANGKRVRFAPAPAPVRARARPGNARGLARRNARPFDHSSMKPNRQLSVTSTP